MATGNLGKGVAVKARNLPILSLQTLVSPSAVITVTTYSAGEAPVELHLACLPETITAPRTDAVYNCHAYLTKVPIAAIKPFIETFTRPR